LTEALDTGSNALADIIERTRGELNNLFKEGEADGNN
jgi:hypothetical protein